MHDATFVSVLNHTSHAKRRTVLHNRLIDMSTQLVKFSISLALALVAAFGFTNPVSAQDEKKLLSQAIRAVQGISKDTPITKRIELYELALDNYNLILENYSYTDVGLQLESTQKFGDINFIAVKARYITELGDYYKKICEVQPSLVCQGFTSLMAGARVCQPGVTFIELIRGHRNMLLAMQIFKQTEDTARYYRLAKQLYLDCDVAPSDQSAKTAQEYFFYELTKALIDFNEVENATGLIEQISNPFYKLVSIAKLKQHSDEPVTQAFIDRLLTFASEQIASEKSLLKNIASLNILGLALSPNATVQVDPVLLEKTLPKNNLYTFQSMTSGSQTRQVCDPILVDEMFNNYLSVISNFYDVTAPLLTNPTPNKRPASLSSRIALDRMDVDRYFGQLSLSLDSMSWMNACEENKTDVLALTTSLYSLAKPAAATELINKSTTGQLKNNRLVAIDTYLSLASNNSVAAIPVQLRGVESNFAIFKKLLDIGDLCAASKQYYDHVQGTKYKDEALKIMTLRSNLLKNASGTNCGDVKLELLLR